MSAPGFAKCRTYQFCFQSENALYVDHDGKRVLADVEGAGVVVLEQVPAQTSLWVDGVTSSECSPSFNESVLVNADKPGLSKISVACGKPSGPTFSVGTVDEFEGCGWIVSSGSLTSVDGVTDGWAEMGQVQPVPVFFGATGKDMVVEQVALRAERLAEIKMVDPESQNEYRWQAKNSSKLFPLSGKLPSGQRYDGAVLSHLNQGGFSFDKPEGCEGVVVRKLYDAFHGRQRARVMVNGEFQGWWFEPVENRDRRWRWAHFGFNTQTEVQKLEFFVDPTAAAPLWSVGLYEVWGLLPIEPRRAAHWTQRNFGS